ncbi:MDR family MFS transporter [Paenibacillus sp. OAS669]|uniref:MDR family MFS transporter n=1 Tax=Paenibacillus sp. OAS669 TaxID=2663821 RepID=UPI001789BC62|nr:MDR family MFS transporter [Paenibacillus sp. OAS669]MBE1444083.1 EmrB/QacA subfamily drug resistance transporter [Paenibacillus sp. OAS669]
MSMKEKNSKWVMAGLLIGLILSSLDQTIVAAAMPTITRQLGGLSLYSWVFTVYMLASTAIMPIYGKLADLFGRKSIFLFGLLLFLAGSLWCGFASTMPQLIIFRGIQGLGAGALMPISFTIIADIYSPEQRVRFMGLFSTLFAASSIGGPVIGGMLVQWNWSWIFFINLPFGLAAWIMLAWALAEPPRTAGKPRIDWLGAMTFIGAVVSLLLALVLGGNTYAWHSGVILGLFGGGALLLAAFLWVELKVPEPLIPLQLFRIRTISCSSIAGFFVSAALFGAIAYIPLFAQGVIGVSPSATGYVLVPLMLATVVTTMGSRRWLTIVSYRTVLAVSLTLTLIGFLLFSRMSVDTTLLQLMMYMVITGLGLGAIFPALGTAAQHAVSWERRGAATSSNQFFRSVGGTFGISIMGGILTRGTAARLEDGSTMTSEQLQQFADPELLLNQEVRSGIPDSVLHELERAFSGALSDMFLLAALFVTVSLLASIAIGGARLSESASK